MNLSPSEAISGTVNLVVALPDEAKPLIEHWKLSLDTEDSPFRIYSGGQLKLIVSGLGKLAAATAVGYLFGRAAGRRHEAWLNIGIAGHASLPLGTGRLVHKVYDDASGRSWYPPRVLSNLVESKAIRCVNQPDEVYADSALVDMESAGFVAAASRLATAELVQLLKIVSDNRKSPAKLLTKASIQEIVRRQIMNVEPIVAKLLEMSTERMQRDAPASLVDAFSSRWHFTATQMVQLSELLRRWQVLRGQDSALDFVVEQTDARSVIEMLRQLLSHTELHAGDL